MPIAFLDLAIRVVSSANIKYVKRPFPKILLPIAVPRPRFSQLSFKLAIATRTVLVNRMGDKGSPLSHASQDVEIYAAHAVVQLNASRLVVVYVLNGLDVDVVFSGSPQVSKYS